jgi:hypothetical protein
VVTIKTSVTKAMLAVGTLKRFILSLKNYMGGRGTRYKNELENVFCTIHLMYGKALGFS